MPSDNFYDKWLEQDPKPASRPQKAQRPESIEDMPNFTQTQADGTDGNGRLLMPIFYSSVKGRLPRFLERIAEASGSDADADMLILDSLAVISACQEQFDGHIPGPQRERRTGTDVRYGRRHPRLHFRTRLWRLLRQPAHLQRRRFPYCDVHQRSAPAAHAARHQGTPLLIFEARHRPGQRDSALEGFLGRPPRRIRSEGLQGHSPGSGFVHTHFRTLHPAMSGHPHGQSLARTIPKAVTNDAAPAHHRGCFIRNNTT